MADRKPKPSEDQHADLDRAAKHAADAAAAAWKLRAERAEMRLDALEYAAVLYLQRVRKLEAQLREPRNEWAVAG